MANFEKLPLFVRCVIQNFPFIEEDFDALTNYELTAKVVEYLNKVITSQNEVIDATNELSAEFQLLHNYVDHYFDNLDVQEEINNKLDEMVTTGQLQAIIDNYFMYVTGRLNDQDEKIAQQTVTLNSAISTQNADIAQLDSRMDSFTNLEEGSTTGDAELIDGRISFTGRTADNIGGNIRMYQGAAFTSILSTLTKVEGKSVNYHMEISDNANYDYYLLPTVKGRIYLVDANATAQVRTVVLGYECTFPQTTQTHPYYPFTFVGTGATVYVNNLKAYETPYIGEMQNPAEVDDLETNYTDITESTTKHEGKFIRTNGTEASLASCDYYSFTPKPGHYYIALTGCSQSMPLAYQNGKTFPDDSGSYFIPQGLYTIYAQNNDTLKINCMRTRVCGDFKVYESKAGYNVTNSTGHDIKSTVGFTSKAFFIGDSLTNGATVTSLNVNPTSYVNYFNYPYYLNKMMQFDSYIKVARNGATATEWWDMYNDRLTETDCTYFIWLGTNNGLTDTVATDCAGDDYTQFANSNTGNLGKILGKISALNNVKIVLLNVFITGGNKTNTNKAIADLADKYNAVLINMDQDICRQNGYHTAYNGYHNSTHFNNAGYNLVASLVNEQLASYINNNPGSMEIYKTVQ